MKMRREKRPKRDSLRSLFRTIGKLRLPWGWILVGLVLNLVVNDLMLELPDTTADLLSGKLDGKAVGMAVVYYIAMAATSCLSVAAQAQAQTYSIRVARGNIWKRMLGMKMEYFDENDPSDLMSSITNDCNSAVENFVNIILYVIPDIYYIVMAFKRISEYHWVLAVSCIGMIPLKYLYAFFMGRKFQTITATLYEKIGELTGFLADRISHLPLLKAYTNEKPEEKMGQDAAKKLLKAHMKIVHWDNASIAATSVMDILQKFIVVVIAVILLQSGKIDIAMWIAFFLFSQNLFPYMDAVFDYWVRFKTVHGSFHRITAIMDGPQEEKREGCICPEKGDLVFDHVSFVYPGTEREALSDVSFTVPYGTSAAIVGLCGSGKTTSVSLLEGFYRPNRGMVRIGETDLQEIALEEFRKKISYVQQGAGIFGGTLREALTYGIDREISEEEIYEASKVTGFDTYLNRCEKGLDMELAAGGESLSGGQSQRLVLTREVLRKGEFVLLDEPTSALDARISLQLQETMEQIFAGKTRVVITHDLRIAKAYQKIIVLSDGRKVGEGSHEELLRTCECYRAMIEQAKEETDDEEE